MKVYELPDSTIAVTKTGILVIVTEAVQSQTYRRAQAYVKSKDSNAFPQMQYMQLHGAKHDAAFYNDYAMFWVTEDVREHWPLPIVEKK